MKALPLSSALLGAVTAALFLSAPSCFAQGGTSPSGPPGPLMKTLDQLEPRIDLATLPGDATALVVISQPGSYYLSGNLTGAADKHGIRVDASDVTIDLRGFTLVGDPASLDGISAPGGFRVSVRNGTVSGWQNGVKTGFFGQLERIFTASNRAAGLGMTGQGSVQSCTSAYNQGVGCEFGEQVTATDCVSFNNTGAGFTGQDACILLRCTTRANGGASFQGGAGCSVLQCSATSDGSGFSAGANSTFRDSTVRFCAPGFSGGLGSTFTQCSAHGFGSGNGIVTANGAVVTQCSVSSYLVGINAGEASQLTGCSVRDSVDHGILAARNSVISGCTVRAANTTAFGINTGVGCSVTACIVSGGGAGIYAAYGSTVASCTVNAVGGNGIETGAASAVTQATVSQAGLYGIAIAANSSVMDSTVSACTRSGILGYYTNQIVRNNVSLSGTQASGYSGIAAGGGCRIEGNHLQGNYYLAVQSYGVFLDFILRNTASGNNVLSGSQYSPASGPYIGTVTSPNAGNANSWSNIQ